MGQHQQGLSLPRAQLCLVGLAGQMSGWCSAVSPPHRDRCLCCSACPRDLQGEMQPGSIFQHPPDALCVEMAPGNSWCLAEGLSLAWLRLASNAQESSVSPWGRQPPVSSGPTVSSCPTAWCDRGRSAACHPQAGSGDPGCGRDHPRYPQLISATFYTRSRHLSLGQGALWVRYTLGV